jgi:hypothetical protein
MLAEDWSKLLRRSPSFTAEFAKALAAHMTSAELQRGHRNASYKAMAVNASANLRAQQEFGDYMQLKLPMLKNVASQVYADRFSTLVFDWYDIIRQLPIPSQHFDRHAPPMARSGNRRGAY